MTGAESHPQLAGIVQGGLENIDLPLVATLDELFGDMSDHHVFRTMACPTCSFPVDTGNTYHRRSDTSEKLNYGKMARIVALLVDVTLACARCSLFKATNEADMAAFEIELLERSFGVAARAAAAGGRSKAARISRSRRAGGCVDWLGVVDAPTRPSTSFRAISW